MTSFSTANHRPDDHLDTPRGRTTAVVIGGGISGLATAALLARDGYAVTLVEQNEVVGGRTGNWEQDGFRFDTGPSWYLMPEVFDHYFRLLGTSAEAELELKVLDPGYRVFTEGVPEPVDVSADLETNIDTFERIEPGAGAKLREYLDSARTTYEVATKTFLYTSFQSLTSLVSPEVVRQSGKLLSLLFRPLDSFIAKSFSNLTLQQVLGYPAVFLGSSPDRAPSMYHLMSYLDLADGVLYPQGGFMTLIEAIANLACAEGVQIQTGVTVTEITTTPERSTPRTAGRRRKASVTGVQVTHSNGTTEHLRADVVVSTADLHHTETQLLPAALQTYPQTWWDRRSPGPGMVLVYLGVQGELPELAHHSLLFTADWQANFDAIFGPEPVVPELASIYVCKPNETDPTVAPAGDSNLFVLVPVPAETAIGSGGIDGGGDPLVEQTADAAIAQIADWAGIPDLADRIVVRRTVGPADFANDYNAWCGGALGPEHTWQQSAFLRGKNASARVDGLIYAGATTIPGIGLPMCLISAEIAVKRLRGDTTTTPLAEPLRSTQAQRTRSQAGMASRSEP